MLHWLSERSCGHPFSGLLSHQYTLMFMDEELISWLSTHIAVPNLPDLLVTRAGCASISDTEVLIMCNIRGYLYRICQIYG